MKRYLFPREVVAYDPTALRRDADGFYWMMWDAPLQPHRHEAHPDVIVVYVRGSLEHHSSECTYNYEDIAKQMADAAAGLVGCEEGTDPTPPSAVIMCIDSRGGVVSGLNETVLKIQRLEKSSGVPFIAHLNEMAASAAYAMACACSRIVCPPSAIVGSIGTISTMCSVVEQDKMTGVQVELITSGARKADGHPHGPITKAAVDAERGRVDALAASFYTLAGKARGIAPDKLKGLQAAIFLGDEAKRRGLVDAVMSLDDVAAQSSKGAGRGPSAKGNETDRRAAGTRGLDTLAQRVSLTRKAQVGTPSDEAPMLTLAALIAKAEAALEGATDPVKKATIQARLEAYRLTAARAEADGDEDGDEDDDDSKAKKAAEKAEKMKKAAEAAKHRAKAAEYQKKAEEAEEAAKNAEADDEEEEDEEEAEESKAALALLQAATGLTGAAALGAAAAMLGDAKTHGARLASLEKERVTNERAAMIASVAKSTTKEEREMLATWPLAQVKSFVDVRLKSGLVHVDESTLVRPKVSTPGTEESLPAETIAMIDAATEAFQGDKKKFRETQVAAHLESHKKMLASANGAPGRV